METTTALTATETIALIEREFQWRWDERCESMCGETDCYFLEEIADTIFEFDNGKASAEETIEALKKLCPNGTYHDCYPWSNGCDLPACDIASDLWEMITTGSLSE